METLKIDIWQLCSQTFYRPSGSVLEVYVCMLSMKLQPECSKFSLGQRLETGGKQIPRLCPTVLKYAPAPLKVQTDQTSKS